MKGDARGREWTSKVQTVIGLRKGEGNDNWAIECEEKEEGVGAEKTKLN